MSDWQRNMGYTIESHDDTDQIKESKINILIHQYEFFKMQEYESMEEMISRFIVIINDHKSLGKTYTNQEQMREILRSLPKIWRPKVKAV